MSRERIKNALIHHIDEFRAQGLTIKEACDKARVSPATYYRRKQERKRKTINRETVDQRIPTLRDRLIKLDRAEREPCFSDLDTLLRRIADATSTIFGKQPPPRRRSQDPLLDDLIDALTQVEASLPGLSYQADGIIEAIHESGTQKASLKDLLLRAVSLLPDISALRDTLSEHARATGDAAGGPSTDARVSSLASVLADIYADHTRRPPTYSEDPETGVPTSAYGFLVENTFQALLDDIGEHEHAWRAAAKFAARCFDYAPD